MSYLPAPYESPQQDDLAATLSAILTTTVALITSWVLGRYAYPVIRDVIAAARGELTQAQNTALESSLATTGVPTAGWAVASILMVIGSLLLMFRRGRQLLLFGALIAIGITAWAQYGLGYGGVGSTIVVDQWALYWGGAAVAVLGLLPATGRWLGKKRRVEKPSTVIGTTDSGAVLWPGL